MKVFISVDLEGIGAIVHWDQCSAGTNQYEETRALMVAEANAAVSGAFDGGATEVIVNDAHGAQRNIAPLEMDARARLVTGNMKPLSMMEGIDESFDAAFSSAATRALAATVCLVILILAPFPLPE